MVAYPNSASEVQEFAGPAAKRWRPRSTLTGALLSLLFLLTGICAAQADVCAALRSQAASSSSGQNGQIAQLKRQLAALGALQRQRKCGSDKGGGLFNACGGLASRYADVQRKIQAASRSSGGGNTAALKVRLQAIGCGSQPARRANAERRTFDPGQFAGRYYRSNAMLYCVRLDDGYFFPTPHAQFAAEQDYKTTLNMCQYICDKVAMEVYMLDSGNLETEEMISVDSRQKYTELPAAFAYRDSAVFKACDLQRYYTRINDVNSRRITEKITARDAIPIPVSRPSEPEPAAAPDDLTAYVEAPRESQASKKVRLVGEAFLPED
jgi:hypothetical protein